MADEEKPGLARSTVRARRNSAPVSARPSHESPPTTEQERLIDDVLERVENLRSWGQDWKEYDAPPPDDATIEHAIRWANEMYRDVLSIGARWLDPVITASEAGEVTFEWWNADRKLTVCVSEEGAVFTKVTGRRPPFQLEDGTADTSPRRRDLWAWLIG